MTLYFKSCTNCRHYHRSSDVEFDLKFDGRQDYPNGKTSVNIDLYWCDIPEIEDEDFTILSWGTPDTFKRDNWFPQLASVCGNYHK